MACRLGREYSLSMPSPDFTMFDQLQKLWSTLKGEHALPPRSAFDAFVLKPWLPNISIIEITGDPPRFKIRLAGTAVNRFAGIDATGKYLDDVIPLFTAEGPKRYLDIYNLAIQTKEPQRDSLPLLPRHGVATTLYRLVLPCGADGEAVDSFVVGMLAEERQISDPRLGRLSGGK